MNNVSNTLTTAKAFTCQQSQRLSFSQVNTYKEKFTFTRRIHGKFYEKTKGADICDIHKFLVINPLFSKRRTKPRRSSVYNESYQLTSESSKQSKLKFLSESRTCVKTTHNSISLAFKWMSMRYHNKKRNNGLQYKEGPLSVMKLNVQIKNKKYIVRCLKVSNKKENIRNRYSSAEKKIILKTNRLICTRPISHTRIFKTSDQRITRPELERGECFEENIFSQVYK